MLALISGIATQGQLLRPRLSQGSPQVLSSFPSQKALARIRPILRDVVRSGTGKAANISTVQIAGKTGSATVLGNWVTHGWFVGFAPYEAPEIAVVVFLNRGEGKDAARIAGIVFSDYFRGAYAEH
jgi:cell division protein FtsI/penicillin-binding protein 2